MTTIHPLFSTPLYQSAISIDNEELYNRICQENFVDTNKNVKSKRTVNQPHGRGHLDPPLVF